MRPITVEYIDKGKAERGADESVYRMEHSIPQRIFDIVAADLAEDLRREHEKQDYHLKRIRQIDAEAFFNEYRY